MGRRKRRSLIERGKSLAPASLPADVPSDDDDPLASPSADAPPEAEPEAAEADGPEADEPEPEPEATEPEPEATEPEPEPEPEPEATEPEPEAPPEPDPPRRRVLAPPSLGEVLALASEVAALGEVRAAAQEAPESPVAIPPHQAADAARKRIAALPKVKVRTRRWPSKEQAAGPTPWFVATRTMMRPHRPKVEPLPWWHPDHLTAEEIQILSALASLAVAMVLVGLAGTLVLVLAVGDQLRQL